MPNSPEITALIEKLNGLSQDKALGVIGTSEYWTQHQAISKQISKLREDQPSNFNSPGPTAEQVALNRLKNRVRLAIEPFQNRVASRDYNAFLIALKFSTDSNQVESLYHHWQKKLAFKHIANLPDLNSKPVPKRLNKAA